MAFHEVQFPDSISRGATGGPERRTDVVTLRSGFEERNAVWQHSRRSYDAGLGMRDIDDLHAVIAFWEARLGRLHGFRWKDWSDYRSCAPTLTPEGSDQLIGTGNGTRTKWQIVKTYASGAESYQRPIAKPVSSTVLIEVNGSAVDAADYTVDLTTGLITFDAPPASGHAIRAGFEFDVPVRFAEDRIDINVETFFLGSVPQIGVTEIRVTLGETGA